jgi:hypothetical protein
VISIRPAIPVDGEAIWKVHSSAIRQVCTGVYSAVMGEM